MANGICRLSKNVTRSSRSLRDEPPVETITGFFVFAIFSIRTQSLQSELATLRMEMPSSQQKSTELSSNGVAMGMQLASRMAWTSLAKSSGLMRVASDL